MNGAAILLTREDLAKLSPDARSEIQRVLFGGHEETEGDVDPVARFLRSQVPADVTRQQAEAIITGLSEPTLAYLRTIVRGHGLAFMDNLLESTGYEHYRQLTGITSGLTKRVRTVLGNNKAELVVRLWDSSIPPRARTPDNARYRMSKQSVEALRAALGEPGAAE